MESRDILVCVDCIMFISNGDLPPDDPDPTDWSPDDIEAAWPSEDGWQLNLGDADRDPGFSWAPCEACGSIYGGSRYHAIAIKKQA